MNDETIWQVLTDAFELSEYMRRVGTGDLQAMQLALSRVDELEEDEATAFVAGAISATAMVDMDAAWPLAEKLLAEVEPVTA